MIHIMHFCLADSLLHYAVGYLVKPSDVLVFDGHTSDKINTGVSVSRRFIVSLPLCKECLYGR